MKEPTIHAVHKELLTPIAKHEAEEILQGKDIQSHIMHHKSKHTCAFCTHKSIIEAGETNITLCFHCFKIIEANLDGLKRFLDCR